MKRLIVAGIISTLTDAAQAKTDWWELGAAAVAVAVAVTAAKAPAGSKLKGINLPGHGTDYVLPEVGEADIDTYGDWIEVKAKRHIFAPEYYDQWCSYPMRAGIIQFDASKVPECPKYIWVNPSAFY